MGFKEFYLEEKDPPNNIPRVPMEILANIKLDCIPYLKLLKSSLSTPYLYRGMRSGSYDPETLSGVKKIRKDRAPRDMPLNVHARIERMFEEHNLPSSRSDVVFGTVSYDTATQYITPPEHSNVESSSSGEVFMIFPTKFYYIDGLIDMYDYFDYLMDDRLDYKPEETDDEDVLEINKVVEWNFDKIEEIISYPRNIKVNQLPRKSVRSEEVYIMGDHYYYMTQEQFQWYSGVLLDGI